jgi:all-trans-8'-apo-beta-carotenal 15,15'-oxygenase
MENTIVEHPHINPSYEGAPVNYIYMSIGSSEGVSSPPLGYLRLDVSSGEKQIWYAYENT